MAIPVNSTGSSVERKQIELLRAATPARRLARTFSLSETTIALARRAIRRRHPELSDQEVKLRFVELHYGADLAAKLRR